MDKINYDDITQDDLNMLEDVKHRMLEFGFKKYDFEQNGKLFWIVFQRKQKSVKYLYWPQGREIVMIIFIDTRRYELKDLVGVPEILKWWTENNKEIVGYRNQALWFVELFKFSLPILEDL